ncbi:Unknown protein, partial [Striga hermonthica]
QLTTINTEVKEQLGAMNNTINSKYEYLANTLAAIQLQLLNSDKRPHEGESILGEGPSNFGGSGSFPRFQQSSKQKLQIENPTPQMISPLPKIDFPRFDGSQPRSWILKCNGYFKLIPNVPDQQKVVLAAMHFEGRAAQWYQNFISKQEELGWSQFVDIISARFEDLKEAKIIAEFNKLRQNGSYEDYVDRFEELRACMLLMNHGGYSEEYFVASFISGLPEEAQALITMFEPPSLPQAIELGRKQTATLDAISKKLRGPYKQTYTPFHNTRKPEQAQAIAGKTTSQVTAKPPVKLLTASEMAKRREKGLCYNCDEKFTYGHRCKMRANFMIMTEEEELAYLQASGETNSEELTEVAMDEMQMTLNSITGAEGLTTMRLCGKIDEHQLHVLIDSGSTLSFLREQTAKELGCKLVSAKPLLVKVANGQRMVSSHIVEDFKWGMQNHPFTHSLRVLQHEGCDLILGGDWLKACTPIELDYNRMTIS